MRNVRVRAWVAAPAILAVAVASVAVVNGAADAATTPKTQVWGAAQCLKCHPDAKTLRAMQDKDGHADYCQAYFDQLQKSTKPAPSGEWKPKSRK